MSQVAQAVSQPKQVLSHSAVYLNYDVVFITLDEPRCLVRMRVQVRYENCLTDLWPWPGLTQATGKGCMSVMMLSSRIDELWRHGRYWRQVLLLHCY